MTASISSVLALVVLLALMPMGIKWLQRRVGGIHSSAGQPSAIISAIAVGPHQRVVTVEVGPIENRQWLVLGVTTQSIALLQSLPTSAKLVSGESAGN